MIEKCNNLIQGKNEEKKLSKKDKKKLKFLVQSARVSISKDN